VPLPGRPVSQPPPHPLHDGPVVLVVVVVVVVVVVGHVPQSCGHVPQSSEGPQSPSPHTQLHGGDPPVQLQRPALQSEMRDFRHALPASFVRPLAAASSLQAFRPQSGAAFATEARTPPPKASTATPVSTFRAAMGRPPASAEAARAPDHPLTSTCGNAAAGNTRFGLRRGSLTPVLPLSREEKYRRGCGTDSPRRGGVDA
jgi:hypothetical protein